MRDFLIPRAERMTRLFPNSRWIDLVHVVRINDDCLQEQRTLAKDILLWSARLDNTTPNGAVMMRPEIADPYKELRNLAFNCACANLDGISHMSEPILRTSGMPAWDRPYSTHKWHSDIWRGEPRHSLNVIIPLWGRDDAGVEYSAPHVDTFVPLNSYDDGDANGDRLHVPFVDGFAYFSDGMVLHKTVKHPGNIKGVSVDFRLLYRERLAGEESPWTFASEYREIENG